MQTIMVNKQQSKESKFSDRKERCAVHLKNRSRVVPGSCSQVKQDPIQRTRDYQVWHMVSKTYLLHGPEMLRNVKNLLWLMFTWPIYFDDLSLVKPWKITTSPGLHGSTPEAVDGSKLRGVCLVTSGARPGDVFEVFRDSEIGHECQGKCRICRKIFENVVYFLGQNTCENRNVRMHGRVYARILVIYAWTNVRIYIRLYFRISARI